MSLLEKSSLILTPNATKEGKLYSVVPNTTLGDMDVVRATTATRVNSAGLIESVAVNVPRIDYTNGSCPSLLVEQQRTNVVTYSEQFDNADWLKSGLTITANSFTAPSGNLTADLITPSISDASIRQSFLPTGAVQNTFSVWLRSATGGNFSTSLRCWRDSPFTNVASTVINVTTQWQRFTFTFTSLDSSTHIIAIGADSTLSTGENCYIWGAQLEDASASPSSYVATTSTTATRSYDLAQLTGNNFSSWYNQQEGSILAEVKMDQKPLASHFNSAWFSISDGSANNLISSVFYTNGNLRSHVYSNNTPSAYFEPSTWAAGEIYKSTIAFASDNFAGCFNSGTVLTDTSGVLPKNLTTCYLGCDFNGATLLRGYIRKFQYYPKRLSNTELQALSAL